MSSLDALDKALLRAMQDGLAVESRPYAALARSAGLSEAEAIARLKRMLEKGIVKRIGLVARHRALGFAANAMAVWDVPDARADAAARSLCAHSFVTLCYLRPRRLPQWRYNLFCMVHGRERETVLGQIGLLNAEAGLGDFPGAVLFSRRCFKQRGARFRAPAMEKAP